MSKQRTKSSKQSNLVELRNRLTFLFIALLIFRIGSYIPVPGLDPQKLAHLFSHQSNNIIGLFNVFSGGALKRFTVFALGIMPYISASIIMQLLTTVVPKLEQLKKEGDSGQKKINQYTRYGTLVLALFQAIGITKVLASQGIALHPNFSFYFVAAITLVTGTMFLMWLGEQVNEKGIGNGISMIIFAGIVSGFPSAVGRTLEQVRQGQIAMLTLIVLVALIVAVTGFVVFIERGQRKIKINYAQRQVGRKMYSGQSSHLPLKINMAGVIPPIFASSIILFPASIIHWFGHNNLFLNHLALLLEPGHSLYIIVFAAAIIFFCYFYTAVVFNPKDTADNLKKSGAFIPGIRPGQQTAKYIDTVMTRLTFFGAMYLLLVSLLPQFLADEWSVPFYFGGTSLLIVVVVVMDFISQVQTLLLSHQYDSLMKKNSTKKKKR